MTEFTGRLSCGVQGPSSPAFWWQFSVLDGSDERTAVMEAAGPSPRSPQLDIHYPDSLHLP